MHARTATFTLGLLFVAGFIAFAPFVRLSPTLNLRAFYTALLPLAPLLALCPLLYALAHLLCNRVLHPWRRLVQLIHIAQQYQPREHGMLAILNLQEMASAMAQFAAHAQDAFSRCQILQTELHHAQHLMTQLEAQHHAILSTASRELTEQYQSVISYAHYLDDHIRRHAPDAQLRYDFDDVCESGFNLRLIAQSLELLRAAPPILATLPITDLLHQTVIALAPSLERRSMKLSSLGVDDRLLIATDLPAIAHALWIVLLGIIRYAADESTLRLRCLPVDDGRQVLLSIVVSELAPGALSVEERHAYLERQIEHLTPHMFAQTIRLHGNIQLAELLLARLHGRISILPLSSHACEISLFLPAGQK